jgi:hypothetical protein
MFIKFPDFCSVPQTYPAENHSAFEDRGKRFLLEWTSHSAHFLSYKNTFLFSQMRHFYCANMLHISALSRHSLSVLILPKTGNDLVTELCPNLALFCSKNGTGRKGKACKMLLLQAF